MYMYIYIHTNIHIYSYIYIYIYVCLCVCMYACIHTCIYIRMCVSVWVAVCLSVYFWVCVCLSVCACPCMQARPENIGLFIACLPSQVCPRVVVCGVVVVCCVVLFLLCVCVCAALGVEYARRMGQPTQRATNYTARSNIDTAQIFLHANGQRPKRASIRQRSRRRQRRGKPHTEHGLGVHSGIDEKRPTEKFVGIHVFMWRTHKS